MPADLPRRSGHRDRFLSEEDLDLANLSWDELLLWWDHWLLEAQAWNEDDEDEYAHGVFAIPRSEWPATLRERARPRRP
jgi:hypothetical protein